MNTSTPRFWPGVIGLLIVGLAFTLGSGVRGLGLAGLTAVSWWLLTPMYAFILGHIALIMILPATSGIPLVAGAEIGLITMLLTSTMRHPRPGRVLALAASAITGAIVLTWLSLNRVASIWGVGGLVLGVSAILAYWIDRYERVVLRHPGDQQ